MYYVFHSIDTISASFVNLISMFNLLMFNWAMQIAIGLFLYENIVSLWFIFGTLSSLPLTCNIVWQVVCPFMLDQFYWAERMFWLGVAPEPLKRDQLLPDKNDDMSIREAANVLSRAINDALSPKVKACAIELAERISLEVIPNFNYVGAFLGDISETFVCLLYMYSFLIGYYIIFCCGNV